MGEEIKQEAPKDEIKDMLDRAEALGKKLEEENKKAEDLLSKNEKILTKIMLSGKTNITTPPVVDQEKENKNKINNMLKGTGLSI